MMMQQKSNRRMGVPGKRELPAIATKRGFDMPMPKYKVTLAGKPTADCIPCEQRRKNINAQQ